MIHIESLIETSTECMVWIVSNWIMRYIVRFGMGVRMNLVKWWMFNLNRGYYKWTSIELEVLRTIEQHLNPVIWVSVCVLSLASNGDVQIRGVAWFLSSIYQFGFILYCFALRVLRSHIVTCPNWRLFWTKHKINLFFRTSYRWFNRMWLIKTVFGIFEKQRSFYVQCYQFFFYFLGLLVNGCINVVITTIEKRFGLRSSQTGLVASGYDIASFVCLVPVTYFGGRANASKPRWIGIGMIIMGLGSMVFSLPHFLVGSYKATSVEANVCLTEANVNTVSLITVLLFEFFPFFLLNWVLNWVNTK